MKFASKGIHEQYLLRFFLHNIKMSQESYHFFDKRSNSKKEATAGFEPANLRFLPSLLTRLCNQVVALTARPRCLVKLIVILFILFFG